MAAPENKGPKNERGFNPRTRKKPGGRREIEYLEFAVSINI